MQRLHMSHSFRGNLSFPLSFHYFFLVDSTYLVKANIIDLINGEILFHCRMGTLVFFLCPIYESLPDYVVVVHYKQLLLWTWRSYSCQHQSGQVVFPLHDVFPFCACLLLTCLCSFLRLQRVHLPRSYIVFLSLSLLLNIVEFLEVPHISTPLRHC